MKKILTTLSLFVVLQKTSAQVGIGTLTPDASAQLDISSTTKGLLIPRMTETERNNMPSKSIGLLVYQTDGSAPGFYYWNGAAWKQLGNTGGWSLNGNNVNGSDFIGTTNNEPLLFKVNGELAGIINGFSTNMGFGYQIFKSITTGSFNTVMGYKSFTTNMSGSRNTALGSQSLYLNSTGSDNVAIGDNSLYSNTTGSKNTGVGSQSLGFNTGIENTGVGYYALFNNISGIGNAGIGYQALYNNRTGNYNTAIGYKAGPTAVGLTNTISIGYNAQATQSNTLILGGTTASGSAVQVGIGTTAPHTNALVDMTSENKGLLIPRVTSANRPTPSPALAADGLLIYQTDGSKGFYYWDGTATTWKQLGSSSGWSLNGNSAGSSDFIGTNNTEPLRFKVNGSAAGEINGETHNTGLGFKAFNALTTGGYNTAIGMYSLYKNTEGESNTALGNASLYNTTTGSKNVAIGQGSLYENNIGNYNTAVGDGSLTENLSGQNNTGLGYHALFYNRTGNNNTAIGFKAGPPSLVYSALSNTTAIGYEAVVDASNQVRIGNTSVTSIGGYAEWTDLSDIRYKKNIQPQTHGLDFIMALQPITYNTDVKKLNHLLYGNKADSINSLATNAKSITAKEGILYSGFSAQQVEEAAKKIGYNFSGVHKPENDKGHYTLSYSTFVVPLVKAVQEQQAVIDNQNKRIEQLEKQLAEILQKLK